MRLMFSKKLGKEEEGEEDRGSGKGAKRLKSQEKQGEEERERQGN